MECAHVIVFRDGRKMLFSEEDYQRAVDDLQEEVVENQYWVSYSKARHKNPGIEEFRPAHLS